MATTLNGENNIPYTVSGFEKGRMAMPVVAEKIAFIPQTKYFGPARVLESNDQDGSVMVCIGSSDGAIETWAVSALAYSTGLTEGDTVLVSGENLNELYIIGILNRNFNEDKEKNQLVLKNGVRATLALHNQTEKLLVNSQSGEIIFEYDALTGKYRINAPAGDLEFCARDGNINFISDQDIRFESKRSIEMNTHRGLSMTVGNAFTKILSSFTLRPGKTKISSPDFCITAQRGTYQIDESRYS
ncbi:hypothetical protein ACFL27_17860, partial [candidate division CSSED10-310 bacterium]